MTLTKREREVVERAVEMMNDCPRPMSLLVAIDNCSESYEIYGRMLSNIISFFSDDIFWTEHNGLNEKYRETRILALLLFLEAAEEVL